MSELNMAEPKISMREQGYHLGQAKSISDALAPLLLLALPLGAIFLGYLIRWVTS
jgi:hypothetical protein